MIENGSLPEQEVYLERLKDIYATLRSKNSFEIQREQAWNRFLSLGLPTKAFEEFRSIKLRTLFSKELHFAEKTKSLESALPETHISEKAHELVFINGVFQPHLSKLSDLPKKVVIAPLQEAMHTYSAIFSSLWTKRISEELDPFALLNHALFQEGLFVYLPPKTVVEEPIVIHQIIEPTSSLFIVPKLDLFLGASADLKLVIKTTCKNDLPFTANSSCTLYLEENAHLHQTWDFCDLSPQAIVLDSVRAYLKANSSLKGISLTRGAETIRQDFKVQLGGDNSEAHLSGLWALKEKRESHTHVLMEHLAPNCHSMQLFKGILFDIGRSSFDGRIVVQKEAQKTEAYQLNHNLILSERARAETKPNLKIFADDVKASHGATVGQLDQEQLFYLLTRGFNKKEAQKILTQAFCQEVLDLIPYASLKPRIAEWET